MSVPLVSVIIPAYNAAPWITDTLASVLAQTFRDYEVIVVDDGSTDGTAAAVRAAGGDIRLITQANRGLSAARNTGIRHSRGRLIAPIDADDLWLPDFLGEMVPGFNQPHVGVACSDVYIWDQRTPIERSPRRWQQVRPPGAGEDAWRRLLGGNFVMTPGVMIRKSAVDAVGGFDEAQRFAEDYDLWLRMARAGHRFHVVDRPLGIYRERPASMSKDLGAKVEGHLRICAKLLASSNLTAEERRLIHRRIRRVQAGYRSAAVDALLSGQVPKARRYFLKAFLSFPHDPRNAGALALSWLAPGLASTLSGVVRNARQSRTPDPVGRGT